MRKRRRIHSCENCAKIRRDRSEAKRIASPADHPQSQEPSFSADCNPTQDQSWSGFGQRAAADLIVDGVVSIPFMDDCFCSHAM
jgi:hypothetical protein